MKLIVVSVFQIHADEAITNIHDETNKDSNGPMTRARAKRFKEDIAILIQKMQAQHTAIEETNLVNVIQAQDIFVGCPSGEA